MIYPLIVDRGARGPKMYMAGQVISIEKDGDGWIVTDTCGMETVCTAAYGLVSDTQFVDIGEVLDKWENGPPVETDKPDLKLVTGD